MIAILSLNVNGMRDPMKRRRVFDVCKGYDISCLQECHISSTDDLASWRAEWEGKIFGSFGTSSSCGTIILLPARSPLVCSDPSFDSEGSFLVFCVVLGEAGLSDCVPSMPLTIPGHVVFSSRSYTPI